MCAVTLLFLVRTVAPKSMKAMKAMKKMKVIKGSQAIKQERGAGAPKTRAEFKATMNAILYVQKDKIISKKASCCWRLFGSFETTGDGENGQQNERSERSS